MAFQPKDLKIFPRGINLLPPGDQVAEGDCLQLDGFWPGSAGRLVQAAGFTRRNNSSVTGISVTSLAECNGAVFYGGGGSLFKIGADAGGATIDTGYDGAPLGLCAYQDMLWVMNRSKQRRVNPSTGAAEDWKVADPPTAPSVQLSGGGRLSDGDHDYYVSWIDSLGYETSPSPVKSVTAPAVPYPPGWPYGTVQLTQGSAAVTLVGAIWGPEIDGQQFLVPSQYPTITLPGSSPYTISYVDDTHGTLSVPWAGTTGIYDYVVYSMANRAKAKITRPNATGVTSWNVYRRSPGTDGAYLVNASPIPYATSTYIDYGDTANGQDDEAIMTRGVLMAGDRGAAPAARVLADRPYYGRLVAAATSSNKNRIFYTNALEPSYFPASNWVDVGDDSGDEILAMSVKPGMLIIYRERSIWRHVGDFGEGTLEPLVPDMGIAGPRAMVATSQGDFVLGKQGGGYAVYQVSDWSQPISPKIEPILNGMGAECYTKMNTSANAAKTCALGYHMGRLWFSYPDGTNTTPNRTLVADLNTGRWFGRAVGFGAFLTGSTYFLGGTGAKVVSLEDGGTEDGSAVALAYQSRYEDCGTPDHEKTFADLVISHNTGGADLSVGIKLDKDSASAFTLATINSATATRQVIPMKYPVGHAKAGQIIEGFNVAVRIFGNGPAAARAQIDGPLILHYFLKPRKARTWDSGPTDLGAAGVKEVDAIEVDLDSDGAVTLYIQSDLPGGVMAERTTGGTGISIAATSGRQVHRTVLTASLSGRIWRYQVVGGPFLLYRVRLRVLPIGVHLDGSVGDVWQPAPMSVGA